jgi:hypothetical protein
MLPYRSYNWGILALQQQYPNYEIIIRAYIANDVNEWGLCEGTEQEKQEEDVSKTVMKCDRIVI